MDSLRAKIESFGLRAISCDGHDVDALLSAFDEARRADGPAVIIAETVKGKGVSFMENQAAWHGCAPTPEQAARALSELEGN